jgi:hypothetical protein
MFKILDAEDWLPACSPRVRFPEVWVKHRHRRQ